MTSLNKLCAAAARAEARGAAATRTLGRVNALLPFAAALVALRLNGVNLGCSHDAYLTLLRALIGHGTLQELNLYGNPPGGEPECIAVGHSLAQLVEAHSRLHSLDVGCCSLGDAGMRPLFAAVARSGRLRELPCNYNEISAACARDVVLPAVQTNASLRQISFAQSEPRIDELAQAEKLVRARGGA